MTTAHRPTWAPAKGGEEQGGMRFYAASQMKSVKDVAGFTKLKFRQDGQHSMADLMRKDLKAELEEKERKNSKSKEEFLAEKEEDMKLLEAGLPGGGGGAPVLVPKAIDADEGDDDDEVDSSDDSSDDEDEEAELLAELDRIRQERAEEAARKAAEEAEKAEKDFQSEVVHGNPLLQDKLAGPAGGAAGSSFAMKRRWDDDVVFRNQARGEPKQQRRFINDTIRNDFHRRFLDRYMK